VASSQVILLRKFVDQKIVANQLQLRLANTGMIDSGINVNMQIDRAIDRNGGILGILVKPCLLLT